MFVEERVLGRGNPSLRLSPPSGERGQADPERDILSPIYISLYTRA
jgi:hypothetical protein